MVTSALLLVFSVELVSAQSASVAPSDRERAQAKAAFNNGDFDPYGEYLKSSLDWYLGKLEESPFDQPKIEQAIRTIDAKKRAEANGHRDPLTKDGLKDRVDDARRLIDGDSFGRQSFYRERVRYFYNQLSLYCSVSLDDECALKYRALALKYE
jgi:hypothetical protein